MKATFELLLSKNNAAACSSRYVGECSFLDDPPWVEFTNKRRTKTFRSGFLAGRRKHLPFFRLGSWMYRGQFGRWGVLDGIQAFGQHLSTGDSCGDAVAGQPEPEGKMRTARTDPPRVSPSIKPNVVESFWCQFGANKRRLCRF